MSSKIEKSYKAGRGVSMTNEFRDRIKEAASNNGDSFSAFICRVLRDHMDKTDKRGRKIGNKKVK